MELYEKDTLKVFRLEDCCRKIAEQIAPHETLGFRLAVGKAGRELPHYIVHSWLEQRLATINTQRIDKFMGVEA